MRRLLAVVGTMGMVAAGLLASAPAPATASPVGHQLAESAARGITYKGLHQAGTTGHCANAFELEGTTRCTHGPDPAPPNIDVRYRRGTPVTAAGTSTGPGTAQSSNPNPPCYDDGQSGDRVQAIYAHAADVSDRYGSLVPSIRQWAADADAVFNRSAAETGGVRHVRFVTDSSCQIAVLDVQLSTTGDDNMGNTVQELQAQGYKGSNRKYLVWTDANVYCGIAQVYGDDSAAQTNLSNGASSVAGEVARVDNACWGLDSSNQSIEAHELMHTLGGVQTSAPHATKYSHCWDDSDRMCYDDGSGAAMSQVCPASHENTFDCNHDDYFSTNPPTGSYLATHWNTATSSFLSGLDGSPAPATTTSVPASSRYTAVTPARVLDTRNGTGGRSSQLGPGQTFSVQLAGAGGVPSSGAAAVALNVTVTNPTASSYLTVSPTGSARPTASNLNFVAGETVPNMVVAKLGTGGQVDVYNSAGWTDVIFDVAGWYSDGSTSTGGTYGSLSPSRILDTRNGTGAPAGPLPGGQSLNLRATGVGGVPSSGVGAVVLNVTAVGPTAGSYLTVYPNGSAVPTASNLNFGPGQNVPNLVIAKVGSGGTVDVYNAVGLTDVVVDVAGWYSDGSTSSSATGLYGPVTPARILDTRSGTGGYSHKVGAGQSISVQAAGVGGVPSTGVSAVVLNVTVTNPNDGSYLTAYPNGSSVPTASNLNFGPGQTVPNLVVVRVGSGGMVNIYNAAGSTDVIVDVAGWYST
ncbi:MAG: hypothetical protein E6G57_03710 [Actinobacteria bacterium]|nr:MAG: hypothetical protein E6G57_03710 [Actinomycetota bacterium]